MSDFRELSSAPRLTSSECLTYNAPRPRRARHLRSLLFAPGSDERKLVGRSARTPTPSSPTSRTPSRRREAAARELVVATCCGEVDEPGCAASSASTARRREFAADDSRRSRELRPRCDRPAEGDAGGGRGARRGRPAGDRDRRDGAGPSSRLRDRRAPRVAALALGAADLGAELRLEPRPDGQEILYRALEARVDSAAAGHPARPSTSCISTRGTTTASSTEAALAARSAMGGKLCIHPAQVGVVNRVFAPTRRRSSGPARLVAAYEAGVGGRQGRRRPRRRADRPARRRAGAHSSSGSERS